MPLEPDLPKADNLIKISLESAWLGVCGVATYIGQLLGFIGQLLGFTGQLTKVYWTVIKVALRQWR